MITSKSKTVSDCIQFKLYSVSYDSCGSQESLRFRQWRSPENLVTAQLQLKTFSLFSSPKEKSCPGNGLSPDITFWIVVHSKRQSFGKFHKFRLTIDTIYTWEDGGVSDGENGSWGQCGE